MFNLQDPNISYLIITPEKDYNHPTDNHHICERVCSILYSKDYTLIPMQSFMEGKYSKSFFALSSSDNDTLRMDSIFLMDKTLQLTWINMLNAISCHETSKYSKL